MEPNEEKPTIAAKQPAVIKLEPGDYWWCACGKSAKQPFCDGAHAGTPFSPRKVSIEETQTIVLCTCKRTYNPPLCDGSHVLL